MKLKHASRELPWITSPEGREEEEYGMEKNGILIELLKQPFHSLEDKK